jgi:type VI secretion system secreted protein VgrG
MVKIAAPKHVLLTAAGAAIEIKGGNITLKGPGKVEFKASMKELAGPGSAEATLSLNQAGALDLQKRQRFDESFVLKNEETGEPMPFFKYRIEDGQGRVLRRGVTDSKGRTVRVHSEQKASIRLVHDDE